VGKLAFQAECLHKANGFKIQLAVGGWQGGVSGIVPVQSNGSKIQLAWAVGKGCIHDNFPHNSK